jgi:hypothetical protein
MTVYERDIKTYSLTEVANMVLPPDMKARERWLSQRLNRGELSGYRVGRTWRMTRDDVVDLIERHHNRPALRATVRPATGSGVLSGLTPTSRRRLERGEL